MWRKPVLRRLILPEPVNLKRFLAPECDFIFGIITYSFDRVNPYGLLKSVAKIQNLQQQKKRMTKSLKNKAKRSFVFD
jgi:hypothetical protein